MKRFLLHAIIYIGVAIGVASCDKSDTPPSPATTPENTSVLIYAVASNNLASALTGEDGDMQEMKQAAKEMGLSGKSIWLYYLTLNEDPALYRLQSTGEEGEFDFVRVKRYTRDQYSTDPVRIKDVISEYISHSTAPTKGLIFWSHGSGWTPMFADHEVEQKRAYGWDTYQGKTDYTDIIELADAIPADTFEYIWFDCCYMGSIELAYQLRDKAHYMVGYSTEVWGPGMEYSLTLPYLLKDTPDIVGAAEAFSGYYLDRNLAVTVGVYDLTKIEEVADYAEKCVTGRRTSGIFFHNYARSPFGPFYDFGEYTLSQGQNFNDDGLGTWDVAGFEDAMSRFVIYKACSEKDFNRKDIDASKFYGITVYYFQDLLSEATEYYKQLDWFKRVYTTVPEF